MKGPQELVDRVDDYVEALADRINELIDIRSPNSREIVEDEIRSAVVSAIVKVNREKSYYILEADDEQDSETT